MRMCDKVRGGLNVVNDADALPGVERHPLDVAPSSGVVADPIGACTTGRRISTCSHSGVISGTGHLRTGRHRTYNPACVVGASHGQAERALLAMGVHFPSSDRASAGGRWRLLRGAAGVGALFWGLVFFGIVDLLAFLQGEEFHD